MESGVGGKLPCAPRGAVACLLMAALWLVLAISPARAQSPDADTIRGELRAGRFPEAERHARELLLASERLHGADSRQAADALDLLAEALRRGGKGAQPEALAVCLRAVDLRERTASADSLSLAVSVENLGALHLMNGDFADARPPLERALRLRLAARGEWHADVARTLLFLGNLALQTAKDDSARVLIQRVIAIQDSVLADDDPDRATAMDVLASLLYTTGEYREAGLLYERVLALQTRTLGLDHPATASTLQNLGALYSEMGDYEEGKVYYEQSLAVLKRAGIPRHWMAATTLDNLGFAEEALGRTAAARERYREALAIQRRAEGARESDLAWTLTRIGLLETREGRISAARKALEEALRIQERLSDPNPSTLASTLAGLAETDLVRGTFPVAIERCARALSVLEKTVGPNHPDLAPTLALLARVQAAKGDTALSLKTALRSARIRLEHLRLTSGGLAERQALAYAAKGPTGLDVALSLVARPGAEGVSGSVRQVWDGLLWTRTLVLDEMAARHHAALEDSVSPATRAAADEVRAARQRLANLLVRGPLGDSQSRYQALLRRARLEMERAERALGERSDGIRDRGPRARIGLQDVLAAVPQGWGIVAYASFASGTSRRYVAFVRGAAGDPRAVQLGDAKVVNGLVSAWAADVVSEPSALGAGRAKTEAPNRVSGARLKAAIWDPLRDALGDVTGVLIVPDGAIHGVNFGALPGTNGAYLVEGGPLFHYVSSELDVVAWRSDDRHGAGLLAFGGIDFGPAGAAKGGGRESAGTSPESSETADGACVDFRDVAFPPLPQTLLEVEEIARTWGDAGPSFLATGAEASGTEFKRRAPGNRVIHLATHGFFLNPDRCLQAGPGTRGIAGLETPVRPRPRSAFSQSSPLLLSGLALASANRRAAASTHEEDGILTAEEVASLDLRSVEWAVLSSCDTGTAGATRGEAILGLRRAFQTAGVRTLILSLWPVQDEAARRWMHALYEARLRTGASTAQAVRTAMLEMLRDRRAQGRSTSPFYWAAFVAAGDWR